MGKTFGDFMREQGGKQPEKEAIPADESVMDIVDRFAAGDGISRQQEIDALVEKLLERDVQEGFNRKHHQIHGLVPTDNTLGDEADYALCETCHVSVLVDSGVTCEGCGNFYADHGRGRNNCWKNHNCGKLVTSRGYLVKEGDVLVYPSHSDEFTVMKMEGTWVKGGHARGLRKRGLHEMPILPRLMYHKETPTE